MPSDLERRSFDAMRAYVTGEGSVSTLFGGIKGVPPEELDRVLRRHRAELYALDPARSVILESLVPAHPKRHT